MTETQLDRVEKMLAMVLANQVTTMFALSAVTNCVDSNLSRQSRLLVEQANTTRNALAEFQELHG